MQPTDLRTNTAVEFLSAFMREAAPTQNNPLLISTIFSEAEKRGYTSAEVNAVLPVITKNEGYKSDLFRQGGGGVQIRGYYKE